MRLLFFQWNAFMQKEIEEELNKSDIEHDSLYYIFKDWDRDDDFSEMFRIKLKSASYDKVFSVNFSPVISDVCQELGVEYVSWIYDCPLHIRRVTALANECNRVYFFDESQVAKYSQMFPHAVDNFKHLPLAVKPNYIDVGNNYICDISLLGQLYNSDFNYLCAPLDMYHRGYLEGLVRTQMQLVSGYILDELIGKGLMDELSKFYGDVKVLPEELEYALACEATSRKRKTALMLLQSRLKTALYSKDKDAALDKVINKGYVDYYTQMPQAFASSKLNLNISLSAIKTGIPLRVLDICGTGAAVISNAQPELFNYFTPGEDIIIFENIKDLVEKAMFYAGHDEERKRIAANGYEVARKAFSYADRINVLFK